MTTAPVLEWQHLTHADFQALPGERTVVMVSCSPLEVHGPHLPVICDNLEADAIAAVARDRLHALHPEIVFVRLPPIYVAADVLPHRGSVMFRPSTIVRVLEDLGRSLAVQGFPHLWVGSFHGGPRHFVPIEVAADRVNRRHGGRMISTFGLLLTRLTAGGTDLTDVLGHLDGVDPSDLVGDSHGGLIETSILLHLLGDRVKPAYRELPRRTVAMRLAEEGKAPLSEGHDVRSVVRGFREKIKYYEQETYSGAPAGAQADIGRRMLDVLGDHTAQALSEVWTGRVPPDACRSPLWGWRHILLSEWFGGLFERFIRYEQRVF